MFNCRYTAPNLLFYIEGSNKWSFRLVLWARSSAPSDGGRDYASPASPGLGAGGGRGGVCVFSEQQEGCTEVLEWSQKQSGVRIIIPESSSPNLYNLFPPLATKSPNLSCTHGQPD